MLSSLVKAHARTLSLTHTAAFQPICWATFVCPGGEVLNYLSWRRRLYALCTLRGADAGLLSRRRLGYAMKSSLEKWVYLSNRQLGLLRSVNSVVGKVLRCKQGLHSAKSMRIVACH